MDQTRAPLLEALDEYRRLDRYGFTPPGHRQGRGTDPRALATIGADAYRSDVLVTAGLDDRTSSNGCLTDAEALMADAVGADKAFFSTCGSSLSVKAAMLSVAGGDPGGLLLSRDAHKSVVAGLVFGGIQPRWVTPQWDAERHISHPPSPEQVRAEWERNPDAAGALIVSPSPYGTCADIDGIARVCHERGKPLIIDEAWGAHLPFHDRLPTWAMNAGADICVVSVHKMGTGFEQGSVFHMQGDLVDFDHLSDCADLLMTTSPNVLIYGGLDGWRRQMVEDGRALLESALQLTDRLRTEIESIDGLHVCDEELLGHQASHDLDRMQILIDVTGTGASGYQCGDWLREHARIDVGMTDHRRILATMSLADDHDSAERLLNSLRRLASAATDLPEPQTIVLPTPDEIQLESVTSPRAAFLGPTETVPASRAAGRIAAEQLTPYPPGIPVAVPGERLDTAVIDYLRSGVRAGMAVPDATHPRLDTFLVVRE
ncbi:aminotransferase class I/II-fold pyridoxal phosphate-dependent enzyme [Prescottella sp. R16]|uniref:aminotransferase class I/II-fold pyridoxal phosphate-dependent enzyme n=1 Tax=Prescottella sp. R16 TaxID=3064529 RepID=UPI00272E29BD|nr:ornithine decarboxylase [Prescottella sp. R16]